jgi:hypothetical protein
VAGSMWRQVSVPTSLGRDSANFLTCDASRAERAWSEALDGASLASEAIKPEGASNPDRAAVLRRREPTRFSSASDDEVGGLPARSAASGASN